jgi:hypothetical protein
MNAPEPLTHTQKKILFAVAVLTGLTRLLAPAASLMDWDEALFSLGIREYEVPGHSPHPPGYPLFIAAAKFVSLFGVNEFRSLQVVVVLGALCLLPTLFALAREVGFSFEVSLGGAAIYCFLPNVWVYGGTGFSDVPANAVVFAACTLLLRGRRDPRAYVLGAAMLGVAAGIRPTNLLVGAVPSLIATWYRIRERSWGTVAAGLVVGAVIAGGSYAGAALASSSVEAYLEVVETQSDYVRRVDSWQNPGRPNLRTAAKIFLIHPFDHKRFAVMLVAAALVAAIGGLLARRKSVAILLAMYVPLALISWLNFDLQTASRYAVNYMALHAVLAADGFFTVGALLARRSRRGTLAVGGVLTLLAIGMNVPSTLRALNLQRTTNSPPAAALEWVKRNVPESARVYVHGSIGPHATYLLAGRRWEHFEEFSDIAMTDSGAWVVHTSPLPDPVARFDWPRRNPLFKISRARNFEAAIAGTQGLAHFEEGWYAEETDGVSTWRWMGRRSRTELPMVAGKGTLTLRLNVPLDATNRKPVVEIRFNGNLLEAVVAESPDVNRTWVLEGRRGGVNELVIVAGDVIVPASRGESEDTRELGLMLRHLSWRPAN